MPTNPKLQNHLMRELMHTIRLKGNGDVMVLLALSGKETFPVFTYVVQTKIALHFTQATIMHLLNLESYDKIATSAKVCVRVSTSGALRLFSRFVRDLNVIISASFRLPIDWASLEDLTIYDVSAGKFLDGVANGTILLANLRKLMFRLTFNDLIKTLLTACFPFPEEVTLTIEQADHAPTLHGAFKTFPRVKRLKIIYSMNNDPNKFQVLNELPAVIKCFPGLKSVKIMLRDRHDFISNHPEIVEVAKFHEQLQTADFSVPVDVTYHEFVYMSPSDSTEEFNSQLKSIGFKAEHYAYEYIFSLDNHNVKLFHQICEYELYC
uniref:F-box domain-containing protein n=1 Tax=Panagrellus redivivus TaxID=6233 RepID=A0A7E4W1V8_PANRE